MRARERSPAFNPFPRKKTGVSLFSRRGSAREERRGAKDGLQGASPSRSWRTCVTVMDPGACFHEGVLGFGCHVGTLRGMTTDYCAFVWHEEAPRAYEIAQAIAWCLTYDSAPLSDVKKQTQENGSPVVWEDLGPSLHPTPKLWPPMKGAKFVDALAHGKLWVQGPDARAVCFFARNRIDKAPSTWNHRQLYLQGKKFAL